MKSVYIAAVAMFYIALLAVIVFKSAYDQGNTINMVFSASSFTIIISLIKFIVTELQGKSSAGQRA